MEIRPAEPSEYREIGELLVDAYGAIDGFVMDETLADELRGVAARAKDSLILVAVEDGRLSGTVTYVPNQDSSMAEFDDPSGAGIRMLAVARHARRRGVAAALSRACIDEAYRTGRSTVYLHTTQWMTGAATLYTGLGFHRDPGLDWEPEPGLILLGYRRNLA
jgi:predicted N-acetyltransferase YhbS